MCSFVPSGAALKEAVSRSLFLFSNNVRVSWFTIMAITSMIGPGYTIVSAQQIKKPFTVAEEIGLAHFGDPYGWQTEDVEFSPDGKYFTVCTECGRLDLNRPESSL